MSSRRSVRAQGRVVVSLILSFRFARYRFDPQGTVADVQ